MGNEHPQLPGLDLEEKAVEVSDFWSQHSATVSKSENASVVSVFLGELFVSNTFWSAQKQTPLEKYSKNLMLYRHPCILKYISSFQKTPKFYLIVEEVSPLSYRLSSFDTNQICAGLHSVLKALRFLHEKASVSHNNVCLSSVYVAKDGTWKLGGVEYLCKHKDLTSDYLSKSKPNRCNKSIDPNEDKASSNIDGRKDFVDVYAFGALVCGILRNKSDDDVASLSAFRDYCKNELQNPKVSSRPKLCSILEHEFFKNDFIAIHSFLSELPLKTDDEKSVFFGSLSERLRGFDESVVASQLSGLLLSRMVLLNGTAQEKVLPNLLAPKNDEEGCEKFFSERIFKKFISPKVLEIMKVRDAQVRLLLLRYFDGFSGTFTVDELQCSVLPELLVGIKDTDNHLVSITLRCLADLVPILGASTVIGGKRAKLFNDGRPNVRSVRNVNRVSKRSELSPNGSDRTSVTSSLTESVRLIELSERPRPDGEENETSTGTDEVEQSIDEAEDNWEDWDSNDANRSFGVSVLSGSGDADSKSDLPGSGIDADVKAEAVAVDAKLEEKRSKLDSRSKVDDIAELDIKNQVVEFDFFRGMEPVIDRSNLFLVEADAKRPSSKLALSADNADAKEEGWEDDDWE